MSHFASNGSPGKGVGGTCKAGEPQPETVSESKGNAPSDRYRECEAYLQRRDERGQTQGNWNPDDPNRKLPASGKGYALR